MSASQERRKKWNKKEGLFFERKTLPKREGVLGGKKMGARNNTEEGGIKKKREKPSDLGRDCLQHIHWSFPRFRRA